MGCHVAKIEDQETWLVFQSTSGTCFAPMFNSRLTAEMFARIYHRKSFLDTKAFEEQGQVECAGKISIFLDEKMPKGGKYEMPQLPKEWKAAIIAAVYGDDPDDAPANYNYDDLEEDVERSWKSGRADVLSMLVDWFSEWDKR